MKLTLLVYGIYIPGSHSLKDKRKVTKSLKDKLRLKFNVSVSEVDHADLWQKTTIAVAMVTSDARLIERMISNVDKLIYNSPDIQIISNKRFDY